VSEIVAIILAAGLALSAAAILLLGWLLARERAARRAAEAALAAAREAADARAGRLDLLDRRRAAIAPLESLWLAWAGGRLPDQDLLAQAARALAEARLLFGDPLQAELDEAALLIVEHVQGLDRQRAAVAGGRHGERTDLIAEEIERERRLRPLVADLRLRLVEAARPS
jgi:hypothetical protein